MVYNIVNDMILEDIVSNRQGYYKISYLIKYILLYIFDLSNTKNEIYIYIFKILQIKNIILGH